MQSVNPAIFKKKYDIRGKVGADLDETVAMLIGKAFGAYVAENDRQPVYVGHDNRATSPALSAAFCDGLLSTGCDVVTIGMVPTPVLYFASTRNPGSYGVMVTASHLATTYNGFKFCRGKFPIFGNAFFSHLAEIIADGAFPQGAGARTAYATIVDEYVAYIAATMPSRLSNTSVVVDGMNGAASLVAPLLLEKLGATVHRIHCDAAHPYSVDQPDPSHPKNLEALQKAVQQIPGAFGIAYDGDADRMGVVDELGRVVFADRVLTLFARDVLAEHPGAKVVFDILCTQVLEQEVERCGGVPVPWASGHALIKDKFYEVAAILAGESSGHIIFADRYLGYDDGIYASARLVETVHQSGKPLSELIEALPATVMSEEERPHCPDDKKFQIVDAVREALSRTKYPLLTIDGVRVAFPNGWGLLRAANTEAVLSLRFEASTAEEVREYREFIWGELSRVALEYGVELVKKA